ncbi:hypothetical protein WCQ02_39305 [Paraburkholderia tropica]|uniref:Uncharacterized protein n=1 Tax=Paraburkholderia tropica TaxID=92647 RepID=A0ABX5ME99_9BURK|nr:hypothetical protein [Paraburkholderia tropica]PXX02339.1 hypothetical protein C7400_1563 [Paraburkholderia tropica]PZW69059.1 hypothetical protein C7399_1563 [Paraburkholderia tropica]
MLTQHKLVEAALQEAAKLRFSNFAGDDDAVLRLLNAFAGADSVADDLWQELPINYRVEDVANLLSLWCWRTDDNGTQIMRAVEHWIVECADENKIRVALSMDAYPFIDTDVCIANLKKAGTAFPALHARCEEIISDRLTERHSPGATL